jgi:FkbM family methyltransferase
MYKKPRLGQVVDLVGIYERTFGYITDGYFVDFGAFDCVQWSNTYILAQAGWSGLMVEPQPALVDKCEEALADYPNVKLVEAAVSNVTTVDMMRLAGSVSTLSEEQVDAYEGTLNEYLFKRDPEYILIDVIHAATLLEQFDVPPGFEVLSIDVEGSEVAVLDALDMEYWRPKLVIIEAHEKLHSPVDAKAVAINDYFDDAGYEKIYCDHINNVYSRPN